MKSRTVAIDAGGWQTQSAIECGGRRSARPFSRVEQSQTWRSIVAMLLLLATGFVANAQYSIDWSTIDGGGGTSTGGVYSVSGTIGQPDASQQPVAGGSFSLIGGFWSIAAVQTPEAPWLYIVPAGSGQATISWTPATPGFVLQESASLTTPNWTNSPSGGANPISVSTVGEMKFYRLTTP